MATLPPSPPPFTFRIIFSGLCFFDTQNPVDPGSQHTGNVDLGKVRVLLPNLLLPMSLTQLAPAQPPPVPGVAPPPPPPPVLDPHFPLLEFSTSNLFTGPLPPGMVQREADFSSNTKDHPGSSCCLLLAETLTVLVDDQAPASGSVEAPPFVDTAADSLFWLASLKKVFGPTAPTLQSGLVPQPGNKPGVITNIELTQGSLSTSFRSPDEFIVNGMPNFSQRLALELIWEITGVQNRVILEARQPDGSVSHLALAPDPDDPLREAVEVHIQNREIDSFIGIPTQRPEYQSPGGKFDFAVYKDLLSGQITNLQVPLSKGAPAQPGATRDLGSCPPGTH